MRTLELLSPAKNLEYGIAAIDHGADAVYIGPQRFGARAAAGNSTHDIATLCSYAHQYGAKVYATVNTLLHDDELNTAIQLIRDLNSAGVDAILIQDLRLLPYVPNAHASTQTDNRTADKVRWLRDHGCSRVVLARELTLDEIADIHRDVPDVELEVFVHGALCVSYSGQCYASEHCFARSANRGECAQFCRMPFDLADADGNTIIHQRHLLSLKDLCLYDHLEALAQAGATSFKIEGRLKDLSYVKNVTAAYSQRLNQLVAQHPDTYARASRGQCTYTFTPDLNKTFHRGYTTYFLHGRQPHIANHITPKAMGEPIGTVATVNHRDKSITIRPLQPASTPLPSSERDGVTNGDGLCFVNDSRQLEGFRVNSVHHGVIRPYPMPATLRPGITLYRNSAHLFERILAKPSATRKIPLTLHLQPILPTPGEQAGEPGFQLTATDGSTTVQATIAAPHDIARTPQHDRIVSELTKFGGTPYQCQQVELPPNFPYFIPAARLAQLRREVIRMLQEEGRSDTPPAERQDMQGNPSPLPWGGEGDRPFPTPASSPLPWGGEGGGLMQCRYCLRHELGSCPRQATPRPFPSRVFLRLADGRQFPIAFDCKHCQMNIYAND